MLSGALSKSNVLSVINGGKFWGKYSSVRIQVINRYAEFPGVFVQYMWSGPSHISLLTVPTIC